MSGLGLMLSDRKEIRALMRERLASGDWWIFVAPPHEVSHEIETRFYSGERNEQFHVFLGPLAGAICPLVLARKKEMPRTKLAKLLVELGGDEPPGQAFAEALKHQDVLFISEESAWFALAFNMEFGDGELHVDLATHGRPAERMGELFAAVGFQPGLHLAVLDHDEGCPCTEDDKPIPHCTCEIVDVHLTRVEAPEEAA